VLAESIRIVSDREVIRYVLQQPGSYGTLLGAGASAEAGVPTASEICDQIRGHLREADPSRDDGELDALLKWQDPKRRYSTCLLQFGNAAQRVEYFRRLLRAKQPAFSHHATALLMQRGVFMQTCLTTNFDKLIELAFAQQGDVECQPIRMQEEARFWGTEPDKCYAIKLHGDYDTHNILNTRNETLQIEPDLLALTARALRDCGLVVLGAAGHEESVLRFLSDLTSIAQKDNVLSMGLFWGIYVGSTKREELTEEEWRSAVLHHVESGAVSEEVVELMARADTADRPCAFFPVQGAGSFLFRLINAAKDSALEGAAELYLDHEMRLRHVFEKTGLSSTAIDEHISALAKQRQNILAQAPQRSQAAETVWTAENPGDSRAVQVVYGDITSRSLMGSANLADSRRAVVSPEDTCISAGGGVAFALLAKAGPRIILNELSKLSPIGHCDVAVTSGGNLPVHYILHAAAIRIESDATYSVTERDVSKTFTAALECAAALGVEVILAPLIAAGVGPLTPAQSFAAIIRAFSAWDSQVRPLRLVIVIYKESLLPRADVESTLRRELSGDFELDRVAAASGTSIGDGSS
jgi:O-acetyl-ADP-ribose deacetylase (regulator of RNase III)